MVGGMAINRNGHQNYLVTVAQVVRYRGHAARLFPCGC